MQNEPEKGIKRTIAAEIVQNAGTTLMMIDSSFDGPEPIRVFLGGASNIDRSEWVWEF